MTKVKCVKGYFDTKLNRHVSVNEEFEVTDDRAKQLVKARVAEATPTTPKEVATPKTRKKKEA
jgi:hypothetical protein